MMVGQKGAMDRMVWCKMVLGRKKEEERRGAQKMLSRSPFHIPESGQQYLSAQAR